MLLKLISCGSLALVSVLVVTLLQGLRQHNQRIESQPSLDKAWIFHSHDSAVNHALSIGEVHGETPNVVKLDQ